jgi:hypothetical protein
MDVRCLSSKRASSGGRCDQYKLRRRYCDRLKYRLRIQAFATGVTLQRCACEALPGGGGCATSIGSSVQSWLSDARGPIDIGAARLHRPALAVMKAERSILLIRDGKHIDCKASQQDPVMRVVRLIGLAHEPSGLGSQFL